jgi:hypothetical protein
MASKSRSEPRVIGSFISTSLDSAQIDARSSNGAVSFSVPGCKPGDIVHVSPAEAPTTGVYLDGYVSAAGTVGVVAHNFTVGTPDPAALLISIVVTRL